MRRFWTGVCKLEQREMQPAAEAFAGYLTGYAPRQGYWVEQAQYLLSVVLAEQGKYALAVRTVSGLARELPEKDPRRLTYELYASRWRTARDASKAQGTPAVPNTSEAKAPETKPAETKSAETKPPEKAAEKKPAETKPSAPKAAPVQPTKPATPPPASAPAATSPQKPAPTSGNAAK